MLNELVIIQSHSNNQEKINILKKTISFFKENNYKILLSSNFKDEKDIIDLVDYYILDKDNPLIYWNEYDKGGNISVWYNYPAYNINIKTEFNHSFAALTLIKNGLSLAYSKGYEKVHVINYDYIPKDKSVFEENSELLNTIDGVFYKNEIENWILPTLFSTKPKILLELTEKIKNKQDYCNHGYYQLEDFLYNVVNSSNINQVTKDIRQLSNKIELDTIELMNDRIGIFSIPKKIYTNKLSPSRDHNGEYWLFSYCPENDPENKIQIKYKSQIFNIPIVDDVRFIHIPIELIENGFELDFTLKQLNKKIDKYSNFADCEIREDRLKINNIYDYII